MGANDYWDEENAIERDEETSWNVRKRKSSYFDHPHNDSAVDPTEAYQAGHYGSTSMNQFYGDRGILGYHPNR
jgi:hypothetical protein